MISRLFDKIVIFDRVFDSRGESRQSGTSHNDDCGDADNNITML